MDIKEQHRKAVKECKDYVKRHGGKSAEGFVRTPNGPRSIDDELEDKSIPSKSKVTG